MMSKVLKFIGIILLGYAVITACAVLNLSLEWVTMLKVIAVSLKLNWGSSYGFLEVGSAVIGIAMVVI
jgi:hypothetical protein